MYTNSFNQQVISGIATIDISDHLPIFCVTVTSIKLQKQTMSFRDYISFNEELYKNDISAIDWNAIYMNLLPKQFDLFQLSLISTPLMKQYLIV